MNEIIITKHLQSGSCTKRTKASYWSLGPL